MRVGTATILALFVVENEIPRRILVDLKICECVKTGVNVWSDSGVRLERLEGPGGHDRDLRFY